MSAFTTAENALIQHHLQKIIPIQDGFQENLRFLNEYFTLIDCAIDNQLRNSLAENLRLQYPNRTDPFVFHGISIQKGKVDKMDYYSEILLKQAVLVVLESQIGCVFCTDHYLSMELGIRNTISEEDINTQNSIFRYRVFCFAELEHISNK